MFYLITKDQPPFRQGQAIWVIDSGVLNKDSFSLHMLDSGFECDYIDGDSDQTMAICRPYEVERWTLI